MYMGPLEAAYALEHGRDPRYAALSPARLEEFFIDLDGNLTVSGKPSPEQIKKKHQAILRVTDHIENLRFNTAIAAMIEWNNDLVGCDTIPEEVAQTFLVLLNPLAPHISEELWQRAQWGDGDLSREEWPQADEALAEEDTITLPYTG